MSSAVWAVGSALAESARRLAEADGDDHMNDPLFANDDIEPWRIAVTSLLLTVCSPALRVTQ